ncbi:MAG: hypothetical protein CMK07_10625 [Ponticaulis sp.]|nr:hypothetical protein [Ponticaulis sp.]
MIWFAAGAGMFIVLQLLYLGICRKEVEDGFAAQQALLHRFGGVIDDVRRRANNTHGTAEHLNQRLTKVEVELSQLKLLLKQIIEKQEKLENRNYFSDVS